MTQAAEHSAPDDAVMKLFLMQHMPLSFNALVVERTTRCTAQCGMCYQAAGPRGSDTLGDHTLSEDVIRDVIRDAAQIETLYPRFHLTGGEGFLDIHTCLRLFAAARAEGFLDLTTTTNAYWAKDPNKAHHIVLELRNVGVTSVEISWDAWHLPYVSADAVSNCLEACADIGIETNLRLLASRSHHAEEALAALRPASLERATRISSNPVFPTGRGARTLERDDLYTQGSRYDSCHTTLNLTVNARGQVAPCCAGLDQTQEYIFGNVQDESLITIAERMNASPMLRTIVFGGISALYPILEAAGLPAGRDYTSICHACWSIFSDPARVQALRAHFEDGPRQAVLAALAKLEAQSTGPTAGAST